MSLQSMRRPKAFYTHLFALACPIMLQNLITTSLGFVDTFMVGLVGNDPLSAVTAANSLVFFIQMVIFGLMSGLTILVSQYWGKGDLQAINRTFGVALYTATPIACLTAFVCWQWPQWAMRLVTDHENLIAIGADYLQIVGFSLMLNTLSSLYIALQRSTENSNVGMVIFGVSMVLNTFLNYCFIFGHFGAPAMGAVGAAYGTLLARVAECLLVIGHICFNHRIPLMKQHILCPGKSMAISYWRSGLPVLINETMWGLGTTAMVSIMGHMAIAGDMLPAYAIIGNIDKISTTVCIGMATATGVLIGKSVGEGAEREELGSLADCLLIVSVWGGIAVTVVMLALLPTVFTPYLFPLFELSPASVAIASTMTIVYALVLPSRCYAFSSLIGVMRAGGSAIMAMIVDLVPLWGFAVPLIAVCGLVIGGPMWIICLGIHCEMFVKTPWCVWQIKKNNWMRDLTQEVQL